MFGEIRRNRGMETRFHRQFTILSLMVLLVGIFCSTAQGQILYGSLTGNVTDQTSAVVPQAKVEALNVGTGVIRNAETDANGIYRFPELLAGNYKITFTASNFAPIAVENVRIDVNAVRRVDARLKVAATTQAVEVTAAPALLQTDRADVHTNISATQITNLPISSSEGRSWQSLYNLVPGASPTGEANSQAGNPQRAMNTNVNGGSNQNNNTRIDGAQNLYPWLPANVAYVPPADAIETVNIVTNSFDAEQGMAGGMAANVQIKSGTNQFHGSGHEFHSDDHLRAENYFQQQTIKVGTQTVPFFKQKDIQNQWGGTFGGPIVKDKLFFFGDFEQTTEHKIAARTFTVPTDAMRAGDFSSAIPVGANCNVAPATGTRPQGCIFDPNTGNADGTGRLAFPNNIIPANRIDPAAAAMLKLIPEPNLATTDPNFFQNNYLAAGNQQFNRRDSDLKINYVPNSRSTIFGRYSYSSSFIFDPPALGAAGGDALNGGQLGNAFSRVQSAVIGGTYTLTPNLLFDGNFGYTRQRLDAEALDIGSNFGLDTLHIPGTNGPDRLQGGVPAFQFNTWSNLGNPNTGNPFVFRDNQWVSNVNLGWTRGKHGFRFGMEYDRFGINHFQPQGGAFQTARGTFGFNGNNVTALRGGSAASPNQVTSIAAFLLGLPVQDGKATQNTNPNSLRWTTIALYARDQWQVLPNLTVNYGLRWEYYPFVTSDHGGARLLDPSTMNVLIGDHTGVPLDDGVDVHAGIFMPRLGIAWRATDKTVVRMGYGISADPNNWRFFRNAFPAVTISTFTGVGGQSWAPSMSLTGTNATLAPYGTIPIGITAIPLPDPTQGTVPLPDGTSTTTAAKDFRRGYTHTYNFSIGQEFAGFVADVGYVGSRSIRPLTNMNINPAPIGGGQNGRLLNTQFGHISTNINPVTGRAYSGWGDINSLIPFGHSYYDSLQARVTRKIGSGSMVGLTYTYSKALDFSDNEELNFLLFPFPAYQRLNKGFASYDRPQNLRLYGYYELPFGKGKRWAQSGVWNMIMGGWQTNWILSKLSGTPFTVTPASNPAFNAPGNTETADLIAPFHVLGNQPMLNCFNQTVVPRSSCAYFDVSSFLSPTTARFGNTGRDQFRGPGFFNLDLSIFRRFKLTERIGFEFRAEAFGLTNTPHFGNPGTTVPSNLNPDGSLNLTGSNFGLITSSSGERQIWFAGKITF